jgi:hypothetical protein
MAALVIAFVAFIYVAGIVQFILTLTEQNGDYAEQNQVKYTPGVIKGIFITYWTQQYDEATTKAAKGACLYRASKTDGILDQIFSPAPLVETEEQIIERSENIVPLRPQD